MARRSDHSREELKELVVTTATYLIASEGLPSLTTRKIAAKIGYSPGSIYNVVDNLDHLISLVNERTMRRLNADLTEIVMTGDEMTDSRQVLAKYLDFRESHPNLWDAVLSHAIRPDVVQPESYLKEIEASFAVAARAITPAFGERGGDVRLAVDVLWSSLQGVFSVSPQGLLATDVHARRREMAEFLVETYLKGLRAGAGR